MGSKKTTVVSVRVPNGLKLRIDELSRRGGVKRNSWIVKTLKRESRWKEDDSEQATQVPRVR